MHLLQSTVLSNCLQRLHSLSKSENLHSVFEGFDSKMPYFAPLERRGGFVCLGFGVLQREQLECKPSLDKNVSKAFILSANAWQYFDCVSPLEKLCYLMFLFKKNCLVLSKYMNQMIKLKDFLKSFLCRFLQSNQVSFLSSGIVVGHLFSEWKYGLSLSDLNGWNK